MEIVELTLISLTWAPARPIITLASPVTIRLLIWMFCTGGSPAVAGVAGIEDGGGASEDAEVGIDGSPSLLISSSSCPI